MSENILIVDDDPVQRRLLDNMVRKFGYEPIVAESGDAAIALLAACTSLIVPRGPDRSEVATSIRAAAGAARTCDHSAP